MKESEAIEDLKCYRAQSGTSYPEEIEMAIKALEEIQQYREIGAVEECRAAMEKQTAKRPYYEGDGYGDDGELIYDTWICPCCEEHYEVDYDNYDYCPNCGQHIDRRNEDGTETNNTNTNNRI